MVMLALTAVWFPKGVLDTSGEIMNTEEPDKLDPKIEGKMETTSHWIINFASFVTL